MADKEISGLTAAAALASADLFHISQGGNSRKVTGSQLQAFIANLMQPSYVAGRWYALMRASATSGVINQNIISLAPFFLLKTITVSDLGCRVTTAQASNNFQLAIYASDAATFYPTGNALAATGNISTASAATVSADITGSDVTLQPGLYWAACNQSGATSALQGVAGAFPNFANLIGSATIGNVSTAATGVNAGYSIAQAYGTWPDLTGGSFTENAVNPGPFLLAKAA